VWPPSAKEMGGGATTPIWLRGPCGSPLTRTKVVVRSGASLSLLKKIFQEIIS
jgi:hypothetical protein